MARSKKDGVSTKPVVVGETPGQDVQKDETGEVFVKLNMAKSLHKAWREGEFGIAPKENIVKVFAETGVVPDAEGVLGIADTEENRKVLRRARVIEAGEAKEKLREGLATIANLRNYNKDILESADGPAFETAIKQAEILASVDLTDLGLAGQRDFRINLNQFQAAIREAQAFVLPKLKARLVRMYDTMSPVSQGRIEQEYRDAVSEKGTTSEVLALTKRLRQNGVDDPEKVARDAERGGHQQDKGFGNRPKFSPGSPYPKTRRGQGSQRGGRRHDNEDAEDRSL